jgi:hypothetical protein
MSGFPKPATEYRFVGTTSVRALPFQTARRAISPAMPACISKAQRAIQMSNTVLIDCRVSGGNNGYIICDEQRRCRSTHYIRQDGKVDQILPSTLSGFSTPSSIDDIFIDENATQFWRVRSGIPQRPGYDSNPGQGYRCYQPYQPADVSWGVTHHQCHQWHSGRKHRAAIRWRRRQHIGEARISIASPGACGAPPAPTERPADKLDLDGKCLHGWWAHCSRRPQIASPRTPPGVHSHAVIWRSVLAAQNRTVEQPRRAAVSVLMTWVGLSPAKVTL